LNAPSEKLPRDNVPGGAQRQSEHQSGSSTATRRVTAEPEEETWDERL
jgi:hypothetical protein